MRVNSSDSFFKELSQASKHTQEVTKLLMDNWNKDFYQKPLATKTPKARELKQLTPTP